MRRAQQRGTALVEVALASVVFMMLIVGILDFGRIGYARSRLKYAVSQAARFATTGNTIEDPTNPGHMLSRSASITTLIESLSGISNPTALSVTISSLTVDGRQISGAGGPGDIVTVRANYRVKLVAPYLTTMFPDGELEITAATTFRNEEFRISLAKPATGSTVVAQKPPVLSSGAQPSHREAPWRLPSRAVWLQTREREPRV